MTDNRQAKAVPFDALGPDLMLRFRTVDLIALETEFPAPSPDHPWWDVASELLAKSNPRFVQACVKHGLKKPGGIAPATTDVDDLPIAPAVAVQPIMDALVCAISGRSFASLVAERQNPEETLNARWNGGKADPQTLAGPATEQQTEA